MPAGPTSDPTDPASPAVAVATALRFYGVDLDIEPPAHGRGTTITLHHRSRWTFEVVPDDAHPLGRWTAAHRDRPAAKPTPVQPEPEPDRPPHQGLAAGIARAIIVTAYRDDEHQDFDTIRRGFLGPDRTEHLAWCKTRAHEYVDAGQFPLALTSMMLDLRKHPGTADSGGSVDALALMLMANGDLDTSERVRHFIDGYQ